MTMLKTSWSISDLNALPAGENDYFERKSGLLLEASEFRSEFAKAISAFANSGGGHILLGVKDDGTFDGVPRNHSRTNIREWIEQIIPNLVEPTPTAFRVHLVESTAESPIPDDRVVVVVDLGDSHFAPYQARSSRIYFQRVGGHSVPASHFYLEALRNRIRAPSFSVKLSNCRIIRVLETKEVFFVQLLLTLDVTNDGRITPKYWHVDLQNDGERITDGGPLRRFGFPGPSLHFLDERNHDSIVLPGRTKRIVEMLGVCMERHNDGDDFAERVVKSLEECKLMASVVTETHVGDQKSLDMSCIIGAVNTTSIDEHKPKVNRNGGVGSLGAGVNLTYFKLDRFEAPDDLVDFRGRLQNNSDVRFREFELVVMFFNAHDSLICHETIDIGLFPAKSERHWKGWVVASRILDAVRVDAYFYDRSWLTP